ncbi:MAG: hypothetical protein BV456_13390, partial [Thermoplasmata archaeon M8B2D]
CPSLEKVPDRVIYNELNPTERIPKIIREYIFPSFEKYGFKILKSGLTIKKTENDFVYEINVYKNHRNIGDYVCAFTMYASVQSSFYQKWYKKTYGEKIQNSSIISYIIQALPNSTFNSDIDFDLALYDNQCLIKLINENVDSSIIPFFNQVNSIEAALKLLREEEVLFAAPMILDFCEILGLENTAKEIITWFNISGKDALEDTKEDVRVRSERLKKGYYKEHAQST